MIGEARKITSLDAVASGFKKIERYGRNDLFEDPKGGIFQLTDGIMKEIPAREFSIASELEAQRVMQLSRWENVRQARETMDQFGWMKREVLDLNVDAVMIEGKAYIKRSGWRKIALTFGITTEIIRTEREVIEGMKVVRVWARAHTKDRFADDVGVCDSTEFIGRNKGRDTLHNVETKAATRALNRAISDLVGGGEVSAEEMD